MVHGMIRNVMFKLNKWREVGINCDVTVIIGGQKFHAHKIILAAAVEYFNKLFTGDFAKEGRSAVTLEDVRPNEFRLILGYLYTGEIKIDDDSFERILSLASYYQIECLMEKLFDYAKINIRTGNGFYYFRSADSVGYEGLKRFTEEFIRKNFFPCSNSVAFLDITYPTILGLIDSPVKDELDRFKTIMRWTEYDANKRSGYLSDLIKRVRFAEISNDEIFDDILDYELIINNSEIIGIIKECKRKAHTMKFCGMNGSDLIRFDIFNAKLQATHVMMKTEINYDEFQIVCSADAIYVSAFKADAGNKLYRIKGSRWAYLENSNYSRFAPSRSITYSAVHKTIYASNGVHMYSYSLESKSCVVDANNNADDRDMLIQRICGPVVCYGDRIYTIALYSDGYCYISQYNPYARKFKLMSQLPICCGKSVSVVLDRKMYIVSCAGVLRYDVMEDQITLLMVKDEHSDMSYHSLIGYQNQLYAIRKKWDVIDVFNLLKKKWIKKIHLK